MGGEKPPKELENKDDSTWTFLVRAGVEQCTLSINHLLFKHESNFFCSEQVTDITKATPPTTIGNGSSENG